MLFSAVVLLSAFASVLAAGSCPRGSDDHRIRKLVARADVVSPNKNIQVHFEFVGTTDGEPAFVKVRGLKGLPTVGGPYAYHLHTNPVPEDGNCTKTLGHLDPLNVTDSLVCNPAFPQYCQTGDLSGKHGALNGTTDGKIAAFGYSDAYVRFFPQSHSLLGRSIVIHGANKTRIACGNIVSPLDGTADHKYRPTHKPSTYVKDYPKVAPVLPGPPVIPFNGTQMTDPAVIASLPYPLPVPHLALAEALNINLTSITHAVKFANSEQTITQPKEEKIDGTGPFKGSWGDDW